MISPSCGQGWSGNKQGHTTEDDGKEQHLLEHGGHRGDSEKVPLSFTRRM